MTKTLIIRKFLVSSNADICLDVSSNVRELDGVVGLTLSMARADRCSRPVYYLTVQRPWTSR